MLALEFFILQRHFIGCCCVFSKARNLNKLTFLIVILKGCHIALSWAMLTYQASEEQSGNLREFLFIALHTVE